MRTAPAERATVTDQSDPPEVVRAAWERSTTAAQSQETATVVARPRRSRRKRIRRGRGMVCWTRGGREGCGGFRRMGFQPMCCGTPQLWAVFRPRNTSAATEKLGLEERAAVASSIGVPIEIAEYGDHGLETNAT